MRALVLISMLACSDPPPIPPMWSVEMEDCRAGLLSIWGANDTDIWEVGGDLGGDGPTVMHYDRTAWTPRETGELGDLWWVFGFDGGPVYMGGSGGLMLRYQNGSFQKMTTPTSGTVFGIWG